MTHINKHAKKTQIFTNINNPKSYNIVQSSNTKGKSEAMCYPSPMKGIDLGMNKRQHQNNERDQIVLVLDSNYGILLCDDLH